MDKTVFGIYPLYYFSLVKHSYPVMAQQAHKVEPEQRKIYLLQRAAALRAQANLVWS